MLGRGPPNVLEDDASGVGSSLASTMRCVGLVRRLLLSSTLPSNMPRLARFIAGLLRCVDDGGPMSVDPLPLRPPPAERAMSDACLAMSEGESESPANGRDGVSGLPA